MTEFTEACQSSPWPSLLEYLIYTASNVIKCTPTSTSTSSFPLNLPLADFAHLVINRSTVSTVAILGATLYLGRAKSVLPASARGIESTQHRLLFAALLISSKMFQDRQIKNMSWGKAMGLSLAEVNLMERQMLMLLNYKVSLHATDIESELRHSSSSASSSPTTLKFTAKAKIIASSLNLPHLDMSFKPDPMSQQLPTPTQEVVSPLTGHRHKDAHITIKNSRRDSVLSLACTGSEFFLSPLMDDSFVAGFLPKHHHQYRRHVSNPLVPKKRYLDPIPAPTSSFMCRKCLPFNRIDEYLILCSL